LRREVVQDVEAFVLHDELVGRLRHAAVDGAVEQRRDPVFERADSDGAFVLSAEGRLNLVALVEQEMRARDPKRGQRRKGLHLRSSVAA